MSGTSLARGYLGRDSLTEEKFTDRNGVRCYRTGDRVERNAAGDLFFRGRVDAQVKLRGQRVELEAIEARLAESPHVRDVACTVQTVGGREQLVAHLVASTSLDDAEFEQLTVELDLKLRSELPDYMVPGIFAKIGEIPRSVSGKVQRAQLPVPAVEPRAFAAEHTSPLQESIARAFASALGMDPRSIRSDDDFFLDLGGESLTAVRALVSLREEHEDASLTTRDLYEARTVSALAARMKTGREPGETTKQRTTTPPGEAQRVLLVTTLQLLVIGSELMAGSITAYFIVLHALPWLIQELGMNATLLSAPLLFTLLHWAFSSCAAAMLAILKKFAFGETQPGYVRAWTLRYFKAWLLSHWSGALPWGTVQGTALHAVLLRMLGSRVGARVHFHRGVSFRSGAWDLLDIGDDVTVGQDARVSIHELSEGGLVQGRIVIGNRCTLETRSTISPESRLEDGVFVEPLSHVAPNSHLAANRAFRGLPAADVGAAPEPADVAAKPLSSGSYTVAHLTLQIVTAFLRWFPTAIALLVLAKNYEVTEVEIAAWLRNPTYSANGAIVLVLVTLLSAPLSLFVSALLLRAAGEVRPGSLPRLSLSYLRVWWKGAQLERAGRWLSGSLFWPSWLRLAGMKVGRGCEISTIIDVVPERVSIGSTSFFADGIYLGGPRIHRGAVTVADTALGRDTFLGNHVVVPSGASLPDGAFYGVCTVTHEGPEEGLAWFGHPPLLLPRRQVLEADRSLTHEPGALRYLNRLVWESARFVLPLLPFTCAAAWFVWLLPQSMAGGALLSPAATLAAAILLIVATWSLKWMLLGKVRPGEHALWSCWCSRWDFVYVAWQFWARAVLSTLEGTLLLAPFLRAMGMKIGRRVVLGGGFAHVVDPDMLTFEDDSTVNGLFQAHSFEDRILKVGSVRIGEQASVAHGALIFYDVELASGAVLTPHAVAMKGERLIEGEYAGSPCERVNS